MIQLNSHVLVIKFIPINTIFIKHLSNLYNFKLVKQFVEIAKRLWYLHKLIVWSLTSMSLYRNKRNKKIKAF